jgi:hypothetical protein
MNLMIVGPGIVGNEGKNNQKSMISCKTELHKIDNPIDGLDWPLRMENVGESGEKVKNIFFTSMHPKFY